jgi:putative tryptophan/tyrosine transport system substrate-binding protein
MKRRDFITLLGGAAAWPTVARAQQAAMPVIGFLHPGSPEAFANLVAVFRKGLSETGYVDGQNVTIEYRWAHNDYDRLSGLAADLVRRRVAVIVTPIGAGSALAAKAATTTIPIVFSAGVDPVALGLVASFNRPGGNITGIVGLTAELGAKRLGLLHELLPGAARFAVLVNPKNRSSAEAQTKDVQSAAGTIGRQIEVFTASTNSGIDTAFASLVQKRADALIVSADPMFVDRRVQLATWAARHMLPAVAAGREFAEAGILMSYGASNTDRYRQVGIYTGRILKGEKPADLPVMQSTRFELVINVQTAKVLGLDVPPALLARADEVIE